jgi:hypothetical protein
MEPIFDHEKPDVYGLQVVAWTTDFLIEASQSPVPHRRELLDQLDRACLSILLNTAADTFGIISASAELAVLAHVSGQMGVPLH